MAKVFGVVVRVGLGWGVCFWVFCDDCLCWVALAAHNSQQQARDDATNKRKRRLTWVGLVQPPPPSGGSRRHRPVTPSYIIFGCVLVV